MCKIFIRYGTFEYGAMDGAPIRFSRIRPLPCLPFLYATPLEVLKAGSHPFPTFPYTHSYARPQPFVHLFQVVAHFGKPKVVYPPSDCMGQFLLAFLVSPAVTARGQLFEFLLQFGFGFLMNPQVSLSSSHTKGVSKELLSVDTSDVGLFSVYL